MKQTIIYTKVDEAPALATYSLFPILEKFVKSSGVNMEQRNISLSSRIIATFSDILPNDKKQKDELAYLGDLVHKEEANIIKLPNISASVPQLKACIAELQKQGYNIPDFPENPESDKQKAIKEKYASCLGSAVNPVLREGNSDRRVADAVKRYAKKHPHRLKPFEKPSKTEISYMSEGDFYGNEQSIVKNRDGKVTIELNGKIIKTIEAQDKEILDGTFMSVNSLETFLMQSIKDAKTKDQLWSIHLKATMMKVSDPIMFGHAVQVFFSEVFKKYAEEFKKIGVNSNLGLGDLYKKLEKLPQNKADEIKQAISDTYSNRPNIAMVDSDKGITNLHASNDIIIDASLPPVIREGGKMWNKNGELQECKAVIPDRCYATMYEEIIEDCKKEGQFDVTTMGSVSNVGLMAQKAEEYGSHPTTFEITEDGMVEVKDENAKVLMSFNVEKGDIWRMSRAKDIPIRDWVRLAFERARLTGDPAIFWLDSKRAHDANVIKKVKEYLKEYETEGLIIQIMSPKDAMAYSLKRVRQGLNTISVTGNVIRDYLTDLFPILELGTSAKMLSIVPLLAGGGLFETGAGGSAPKHVEQFLKEGHLRWDSLGEFLALAESLRMIAQKTKNRQVEILTKALDVANSAYLDNNKSPSRKVGEPDNKASHFYLAMYWAEALANQKEDNELSEKFISIAKELRENEDKIMEELLSVEGKAKDIGGYYHIDDSKASDAMRPSKTFNRIINSFI